MLTVDQKELIWLQLWTRQQVRSVLNYNTASVMVSLLVLQLNFEVIYVLITCNHLLLVQYFGETFFVFEFSTMKFPVVRK